jgi:hypothetical protein
LSDDLARCPGPLELYDHQVAISVKREEVDNRTERRVDLATDEQQVGVDDAEVSRDDVLQPSLVWHGSEVNLSLVAIDPPEANFYRHIVPLEILASYRS